MLDTIRQAIASDEFLTGLRLGSVALGAGVLVGVIWWKRRPIPIVGLLWAAAGLVALDHRTPELWLGVGLLAIAGSTLPRLPLPFLLAPVVAVPGAWLVAFQADLAGPDSFPWLTFGVIVVGAPLVALTDRHMGRPALGLLLWAVTVAGIYVDVPDTEHILVILAAAAPLVLLGWPLNLGRLGEAGGYAGVGLLAWAVVTDGVGRPASVVGAVACLGVFLVVPVALWIRNRALNRHRLAWLVALHVGMVALSSRVAGLQNDVALAASISAATLLVGFAFAATFFVGPIRQGPR